MAQRGNDTLAGVEKVEKRDDIYLKKRQASKRRKIGESQNRNEDIVEWLVQWEYGECLPNFAANANVRGDVLGPTKLSCSPPTSLNQPLCSELPD